jgi:enoyl-CoA hydratase
LCVATPNTLLGFPQRFACFGGSARLRKLLGRQSPAFVASGYTLSGREARDHGLVDRAFCTRRAKIELRTFLDELERSPRIPARTRDETGFAQERRVFATLTSPLEGEVGSASLPGGGWGMSSAPTNIDILLARGFITPLEAEQMRAKAPANVPSAEPTPSILHRAA